MFFCHCVYFRMANLMTNIGGAGAQGGEGSSGVPDMAGLMQA